METYEKVRKILEMCEFIEQNEDDKEGRIDEVIRMRVELPSLILEIREDLMTMFE